ncbi:MAG: stage 0 sporulation protein, partial [Chloroflexota bacterium]|nr:stage 0 sporulation protein [Chloroflexota bacterium]
MIEVIGVRFKRAGKIYFFDPTGLEVEIDDWVVVETGRGPELGRVAIAAKQVLENDLTEPLKPVLR